MLTILLSAAAVVLFVLVAVTAAPAWMLPIGLACLAAAHMPWDTYLHRQP